MIDGLKKVAFFCAHTDDEMICAGTLHRLAKSGCEVYMCSFSYAATIDDRKGYGRIEPIDGPVMYPSKVVEDEWEKSKRLIGGKGPCKGLTPSSNFYKHRQEIADYVFQYCEQEKPDAVITLSPEDENPAHRIVGEECERVTRGRVPIHIRCQFPWNYGIGRKNLFVKLDEDDIRCKKEVINCYKSQHFRYQYSEMLLAGCRLDGLSIKAEYAESFEMIRGAF